MKRVLTALQMKEIDKYTINTVGIQSVVLMERAALGVCEVIMELYSRNDRIIVICGSGNNGADGIATARILTQYGYHADAFIVGNNERFTDEMAYQMKIAGKTGVTFVNRPCIDEYNVVVDALFGIGLSRNIDGKYKDIIEKVNKSHAEVIAVDIPSGVNGNSGEVMGVCIHADVTVTFGALKKGIILFPGSMYCGKVILKDAGFPDSVFATVNGCAGIIESEDIKAFLPERIPQSNKGTYGKLLVIAGSKNMCGAACMCAAAAYKTGVGLVTVFTSEANRTIVQTKVPEAVLKTYEEKSNFAELLKSEISKADYIVCGPGIGTSGDAAIMVGSVIDSGKKALFDADAINIISMNEKLMNKLHKNIIITPHVGEFARLTGDDIESVKKDLCGSCNSFSRRYNVICVLKDARTVTCSPEGDETINIYGNSGMSTAGSGDVLAGIIGGLACQGVTDYNAAVIGVVVHAMAGDYAAEEKGQYSLMASDIIENICKVMCGGKDEQFR